MEDTILIGDHILVNMTAYGFNNPAKPDQKMSQGKEPKRGDVVVFLYPEDPTRKMVKRLIGLPGDKFEIRDKQVYIDGKPLDEPYKVHKAEFAGLTAEDFGPVNVPPGYYFVMGDNRDNSKDSRAWGFVPRSYIVGRAFMIYYSYEPGHGFRWNRFGKSIQ